MMKVLLEKRIFEQCQGRFFGEGRWDVAAEWARLVGLHVDTAFPEDSLCKYFCRSDYCPIRAREIASLLMAIYHGLNI